MTGTAVPRRFALAAVAAGVIVGAAYTLSPLTVWFAITAVVLVRWCVRGLEGDERRWILGLLLLGIGLRIVAIAGLFASTDHWQVAFGSFFGDEEYFIRRSIWLRNVAFGVPIHRADLIYAFDDYSYTMYLYVLAFLQAMIGVAPYGLHLFGCALYLTMCVALFRIARERFGRLAAAIGLTLLLFLPSMFAWSISALKEPLYFLLAAASVWLIEWVWRTPRLGSRAFGVVALACVGVALQSIRDGGLVMFAAGIGGGSAVAAVLRRPRLALAFAVVAPAMMVAALIQPALQVRLSKSTQALAQVHMGHITTAGYTYKLLDSRLYEGMVPLQSITVPEQMRFAIRAVVAYVAQPLPWTIQSRAALAYLPEQVVWYVIVLLIPFGIVAGARRDLLLTAVLAASAAAAAVMVALTGGNIGTLVRHRGLALPYLVWFAGLGAAKVIHQAKTRSWL